MLSSLSRLTTAQIEEIRALERELGKTLLSFSSYDVLAEDLDSAELQKVKSLEEKLGTTLIAVKPGTVST